MVLEYINASQSASKQLEATDEVGVNFLDQLDVACLTLHLNGFRGQVREGDYVARLYLRLEFRPECKPVHLHLLDDLGLLLICQPRCGGHLRGLRDTHPLNCSEFLPPYR